MKTLGSICLLLSCTAVARSAFTFVFEIVRHHTNGKCPGFITSPCETYLKSFCLRGPIGTNTAGTSCGLGTNTERVFAVPQTRTIQSSQPWPTNFQLFMVAFDEDVGEDDFLDSIIIDSSRSVSSTFSPQQTFWGVNNRVGVDIRFRVTCQPHYYGTDCSVYCLARDDSSGHYTCDPVNGSRVCNDGFEHPETNCVDRTTVCSSSPCQPGSCVLIPPTDYTCDCPPWYTGRQCETQVNECDPNPCLHGNCMDMLGDYSCACFSGYTGKNCDIEMPALCPHPLVTPVTTPRPNRTSSPQEPDSTRSVTPLERQVPAVRGCTDTVTALSMLTAVLAVLLVTTIVAWVCTCVRSQPNKRALAIDNPGYDPENMNRPSINDRGNVSAESQTNYSSLGPTYEHVEETGYDVINRRGTPRPHPPMTLPGSHDPTADQDYSTLDHTQQEHDHHVTESPTLSQRESSTKSPHYHTLEIRGQSETQGGVEVST